MSADFPRRPGRALGGRDDMPPHGGQGGSRDSFEPRDGDPYSQETMSLGSYEAASDATSVFAPLAAAGEPVGEERFDNDPGTAPDVDADESEDDDESDRLGCTSWLLIALFTIAALGAAGYYGIAKLMDSAPVAALQTVFPKLSMLPANHVNSPQPESEVKIYYGVRGRSLAAEVRKLPHAAAGEERAHLIAQELLRPPKANAFESPLPNGTAIRGLYVRGGIVLIDLSSEFIKPEHPTPSGERLAVYTIVNSFLLNDETLKGVRILIEGVPVRTAWGWLDLSNPLSADLSLIQ